MSSKAPRPRTSASTSVVARSLQPRSPMSGRPTQTGKGPVGVRRNQGIRPRGSDAGSAVVQEDEIRSTERAVEWPDATDAGLISIARIRTPWTSRMDCPHQGRPDGPHCRIEMFEPWSQALAVSRNSSGSKCCIGFTVRGAISSTRARAMTERPAAPFRCVRRRGPVQSGPRSQA
jgi:hypothetical protein